MSPAALAAASGLTADEWALLRVLLTRMARSAGASDRFTPRIASVQPASSAARSTQLFSENSSARTRAIFNLGSASLWVADSSSVVPVLQSGQPPGSPGYPIIAGTERVWEDGEFTGPLWGIMDASAAATVVVVVETGGPALAMLQPVT